MKKTEIVHEMTFAPAQKSSISDINANVIATITIVVSGLLGLVPFLCYVTWIIPVAVYVYEKKSQFVIDTSMQATGLAIFEVMIQAIFSIFSSVILSLGDTESAVHSLISATAIYNVFNIITRVAYFAIAIAICIYAYKAYKYENIEIPIAGGMGFSLSPLLNKLSDAFNSKLKKQ